MRRSSRLGLFALALLLMALTAPVASAHEAYVTNMGSDDVTVIDTSSGDVIGAPIAVGDGPGGIAISPDGKRAYVANAFDDDVTVIDTASDEVVGQPIDVGDYPRGVAVTPDGRRVFVSNEGSDDVYVIDTVSGSVVGQPIPVGDAPLGIAIAPDGARVYVANDFDDNVSVIDTASRQVVGSPIPVGDAPLGIAVTPNGRRVYVSNQLSDNVSVIDTALGSAIDTVPVGSDPAGIAIAPNGRRAYVANWGSDDVSAIDTASGDVIGAPIAIGDLPFGIAITPDGTRAYVGAGTASVSAIDTGSDEAVGAPIPAGTDPTGIAIVPDQPPLASLAPVGASAPGQPVRFDASASHDPGGQIVRYDWSFGDGQTALDAGPTPTHVFSTPGVHKVTVTVTNAEGCSASFVFTGQTASCNGSPMASASTTLQVTALPRVKPERPKKKKTPRPKRGLSNALRVGGLYRDTRRGLAKLAVWVPGQGTLSLRGERVRAVKREVGRGTTTLVVRPKRRQVGALKRRGELTVRLRIAFRPDGGAARTVTRTVKLLREQPPARAPRAR